MDTKDSRLIPEGSLLIWLPFLGFAAGVQIASYDSMRGSKKISTADQCLIMLRKLLLGKSDASSRGNSS